MSSFEALYSILPGVNRDIQTQPSARLLCAIGFVHLVSKRRSTMNIRSAQSSNWTSLVTKTTSTPSSIRQCSWPSRKRYRLRENMVRFISKYFIFIHICRQTYCFGPFKFHHFKEHTSIFFQNKSLPIWHCTTFVEIIIQGRLDHSR